MLVASLFNNQRKGLFPMVIRNNSETFILEFSLGYLWLRLPFIGEVELMAKKDPCFGRRYITTSWRGLKASGEVRA